MKKCIVSLLALAVCAGVLAFKNEPKGFRDLKWGAELEKLDGFRPVEKDPHLEGLEYHFREKEDLLFEGLRFDRVEYAFWNGLFYSVRLEFGGYETFKDLKAFCDETYGGGFLKGDSTENHFMSLWRGKITQVVLTYDVADEFGILLFTSEKIDRKIMKWEEKQVQDEEELLQR